jgi:hypothetical protein
MSYSLDYNQDIDCILLVFKDTVNINVIQKVAPQVACMCEETGCRHVLNDMSRAIINITALEVFHSPDIISKSGISRTTRRALVVPSNFSHSDFLETVTRNGGHNLKVFFNVVEAKAWLL